MKRSISALSLASLLTLPGLLFATERATIPVLTPEEITYQCSESITQFQTQIDELEQIQAYTEKGAKQFRQKWNQLSIAMDDIHGPVYLLSQVSPHEEVRQSAEMCDMQIRKFNTDLFLNKTLYDSVHVLRAYDNIDRKFRKDLLNQFEDAGITLIPKKQERMREIQVRLDAIQQEFSRNIRDNKTRVVFSPEQMRGLPDSYLERQKRDSEGNYLMDFSYPSYIPFMQYADDSEARRQYQMEFLNRGTSKNIELLQEAIELRKEMAQLAGDRSFASFKLKRRMAKKPGIVSQFLKDVHAAIESAEKHEIEELKAYKAQTLGNGDSTLNRWDVSYWQEKLRRDRFSIDQNELRRYFPTEASIRWILALSEKLYGISFKSVSVPLWHEDVRYYDVIDKASKEVLGGIYLDLFPREGKYGHAAAFQVRGSSTLESRKPISVLVTNFNDTGLDGNELETFLHEFGHVLHGVLSKTRYVDQAGTNVERDFVEAPSQMFEEWAHAKEPLALLPKYCSPSCPSVDASLLKRINQARKYGKGIFYARQLLYAKYDMSLYDEYTPNAMTLWEKMEKNTLLGHTKDTEFPGQFSHTISGYAAGYYGYLWSQVLAYDMLSEYHGHLLDSSIGKRYRYAILQRGGEANAEELVRAFLRRDPNSQAFYRELTGH